MAHKLGVHQNSITNYLHGRVPDPEILLKINRMGISIDWLLTGEGGRAMINSYHGQAKLSGIMNCEDLTPSSSVLTRRLPGFERCTVKTIERDFLRNGAKIQIENKRVTVALKKKSRLPILFEQPWMKKETHLSWMGIKIRFSTATSS